MTHSANNGAVHTADAAQTRTELARLSPERIPRFDAALPAARAAIMSRLLGALHREPLPGVAPPAGRDSGRITQTDHAGRVLTYPAADARPFAVARPGLTAVLDATPYDDPAELARALWPHSPLPAELANSVANLALARTTAAAGPPPGEPGRDPWPDDRHGGTATGPARGAAGGPLSAAAGDPDGLGRLEQLVTDGHPLHPCARTRAGMTVADVLRYAPEHRPVIRLRRLRVPPDRWHGDAPPILYAHPWQAERLLAEHSWLTPDGETGPVRPLMSLRTVAPLDGGDHVKTAIDVQMTSAVRTVSPAAVHNGPVLSRLLRALTADLPLTVLAETAAGAVIVGGEPQRRMAYLRRSAPAIGPDETVLPVAALGGALLGEAVRDAGGNPYRWLEDLAALLWPPLLAVLHRGVALEAHGQNTLVVLRHGRPARILYRDLGGVRVSPARLRAAGLTPPPLYGDLISDDDHVLRTKLAAAALGTVAAELVTRLARQHDADPSRLWGIVGAAVRGSATADAEAMLRAPLPVKATTAMRLAADPLDDLWAHLDNPLAGAE
ncbi:MAG TPA: IucA/IucC family protein [Actinoplanes sp.]|nr:IucA/IucC family protein [Actinoplanes sp.]